MLYVVFRNAIPVYGVMVTSMTKQPASGSRPAGAYFPGIVAEGRFDCVAVLPASTGGWPGAAR